MNQSFLEIVKHKAFLKGGECLTIVPTNHLEVRLLCSNGHAWVANAQAIIDGSWCPKCAQNNLYLKVLKQLAIDRGGICLEKEYKNSNTKMRFKCKEGHIWETTSHTIKKGAWCRHCHHNSMRNTIEQMHKLAAKHRGKCISKKYVKNNFAIKWECKYGHKFSAQPSNVTSGEWCPYCARNNQRLSIKDIKKFANNNGGRLISTEYISNSKKLEFECRKGHRWRASFNNVGHGSWCPVCAGNRPKTLSDMKKIAKDLGGKCLATSYKNQKEKLLWECSKGHQFNLPATKILHRGQWCSKCRNNKEKL